MLSTCRVGSSRVAAQFFGLHKAGSLKKAAQNATNHQQVACLTSMETLKISHPDYKRPAPFPYETQKYNLWYELFDSTLKRFDDNTKFVVIEGPIASGKDKFAQQFAKEFGMKYFPRFNFDTMYNSPYGFDRRDFDEQFPVGLHTVGIDKFLKDPHHVNTAAFQHWCYYLKFEQYLDGLIHLLSTGQGVVVQRSPYSDIVFMQAMLNAGYVSKGAFSMYNDMRLRSLDKLMKPHLVIYLDVDAKVVKERINKRNIPYEVKSQVLTEKFLTDMENNYKEKVLKEADRYSNLVVYDWTDGGDFEYIVDDLEELNFHYEHKHKRMEDWTLDDTQYFRERRYVYSPENRVTIMQSLIMTRTDVPEMLNTAEEVELKDVFEEQMQPGYRYALGYDPVLDGNLYWKTKEYTKKDIIRERSTQASIDTK